MNMHQETGSDGDLLPPSIPVVPFEKYMLQDDRDSHPMASLLEVDLSGNIDLDRLRQVLPATLRLHPLLNSTIRKIDSARWEWVSSTSSPHFEVLNPNEAPPLAKLDLEQEPGLKIWARPGSNGATLLFHVHHATCDALGMLTFVIDWLNAATKQALPDPAQRLRSFAARDDLSGVKAAFPLQQRLRNIARYLFGQAPVPLRHQLVDKLDSAMTADSAYHVVSFKEEESSLLKEACRLQNVSLNDWLLAILFQTVSGWHADDAGKNSKGSWRILVPVNRRPPSDPFVSACNFIGYKMLTRQSDDLIQFESLLKGVQQEMQPVRNAPQGVTSFLKILRLFNRFGALHRVVEKYDCFTTVILSNLGDLSKFFAPLTRIEEDRLTFDDISIDAFRCAPPRRPNTNLTIVVMTYAGKLQMMSSRSAPGLNSQETLEFLDRFQQAIVEQARRQPRSSAPQPAGQGT